MSKTVDVRNKLEQNVIKIIKAVTAKYILTCIDNLLAESIRMTTTLGKSLRTDTVNLMDPTGQPKIVHIKKATGQGKNDQNPFPIGSFNVGIDVLIYRQSIDNPNGMKPQGPIVTTIPESNRSNNCDIFKLVRKMSDLAYMGLAVARDNEK